MCLYQPGALLTGARHELIRRGGVLVDGPRMVAAGPLDTLMAGHPVPADVADLADVTLLPGLVDEMAAAGIYVCPTMNVHALTLRDRFGDALER